MLVTLSSKVSCSKNNGYRPKLRQEKAKKMLLLGITSSVSLEQKMNFSVPLTGFLSRLIVIAEKDVVYSRFSIPLINRMEKHFLVMSSGLTEAQKDVTKDLQGWVEDFAHVCRPAYERKRLKFTLIFL